VHFTPWHSDPSVRRAWGFESPDIDIDARFIYVHERDADMTVATRRRSEHVARIVSTKLRKVCTTPFPKHCKVD
jgi:predicted nucleotidyltransferase